MDYNKNSPLDKKPEGSGTYLLIAFIALLIVGVVSYLLFFQIQTPPKRMQVEQHKPVEPTPPVETYTPAPEPESVVKEPVVAQSVAPMEEPVPVAPPVPVAEPVKKPKPLTYVRYVVKKHDMLTSISKKRYGTRFYWPLIFNKNIKLLKDQDYLQPGMVLMIPDQVDLASDKTKQLLDEGILAAYKNYNRRGKAKKARWLLYAAQTQVNPKFLADHKKAIKSNDMKIVRSYLKRFPNPEKER